MKEIFDDLGGRWPSALTTIEPHHLSLLPNIKTEEEAIVSFFLNLDITCDSFYFLHNVFSSNVVVDQGTEYVSELGV